MLIDRLDRFKARVYLLLGIYTAVWGLWVGNFWWSVFGTAKVYSGLDGFMPEFAWGLNALLAGGIMTFGYARQSHRALAWSAGAGLYHWGVVGTFYFFGDWQNTAGITAYFAFFLSLGVYHFEKDELVEHV